MSAEARNGLTGPNPLEPVGSGSSPSRPGGSRLPSAACEHVLEWLPIGSQIWRPIDRAGSREEAEAKLAVRRKFLIHALDFRVRPVEADLFADGGAS